MFATFKSKAKYALSLIEVVIVIVMISSWLLTLYYVIDKWLSFVDWTRKKLIAIEIAKEWMEAVYNIRDTNWTRWSWKRDQCWLKVDPLNYSEGDPKKCEDDAWIQSWKNYVLKLVSTPSWNQRYWILSGVSVDLNIFDWLDSDDKLFQVCLSGWYWNSCPGWWGYKEWRFFREIKWLWLIDKYNNTNLNCTKWDDSSCWNAAAKEFHFCSVVQYMGNWRGEVKMCWVLTNFMP